MFDRFTDRAKKVIHLAKIEMLRFSRASVGTEHIFLGLLGEGSGVASNVLKNLGLDLDLLRREVGDGQAALKTGAAEGSEAASSGGEFSASAQKLLSATFDEAKNLGHNYIGTEHLLLALISNAQADPLDIAGSILRDHGCDLEDIRLEVLEFLGASEDEGVTAGVVKPVIRSDNGREGVTLSLQLPEAFDRAAAVEAIGQMFDGLDDLYRAYGGSGLRPMRGTCRSGAFVAEVAL